MKKSEDGWSKWKSPKKSKSFVSFFQLDSPPAKPTRTVHTFWDLTSEAHYHSNTDLNEDQVRDTKDTDSPDSTKLSPNKIKLPLTKRTGAITKMASSDEIVKKTVLSPPDKISKDFNTRPSKEIDEEENIQKLKEDESLMDYIQAESTSEPLNEEIKAESKEDEKNGPNEDKSSQKKNKSLWFIRKSPNKASNIAKQEGLPTEEKITTVEQENGKDSNVNEPSNSKGEERKILSIFSSLTKKKQTKEELPSYIGNEEISPPEEKDTPKSKAVSFGKFRLFGSSENLIDQEKRENTKEEKEDKYRKEQINSSPLSPNDSDDEVMYNIILASSEITENSEEHDIMSQAPPKDIGKTNSDEDERSKKGETNLTKSKAKSISMKNLFFASGKHSKQKSEKKTEDTTLEKNMLANTPASEGISKDIEEDSLSKKKSGKIKFLFTPSEKHSKQNDEKAKRNSEEEERGNKNDSKITSTESEFFVEIPLSENVDELNDEVKEPPMVEVNDVGDTDEERNEKSSGLSSKKANNPSKMNFLFTSGKQTKNKQKEKKNEASKVKQKVANEKAAWSILEDDRYGSWDKSKHSAFVNLLFAPPERHTKKAKDKEKSQEDKEQEVKPPGEDDQNKEMMHEEEKELSYDGKESPVENNSYKPEAVLKCTVNECKQEEQQDSMVKNEHSSVTDNQSEQGVSQEEKDITESRDQSSAKMNSIENIVQLKDGVEEDEEEKEESVSGLSVGQESTSSRGSLENTTEYPHEIIPSEYNNEEIKEIGQDSQSFKEEVPTIIVTQDEDCNYEDKEGTFTNKAEISSEIASAENFSLNNMKDENEQQEPQVVTEDLGNSIIMKKDESNEEKGKELPMDNREFITEITKCFDEIKPEVEHGTSSKEHESITEEEITYDESSSTATAVLSVESSDLGDQPKQKMDDGEDEKIMAQEGPVAPVLEGEKSERQTKDISTKEKRLSGIIDSLFARPEKHAKPKQDKKKHNSSKNKKLMEDLSPSSDISMDREGSANQNESIENAVEMTNMEKEVSEDQPTNDTLNDKVQNPEKEMDTSLKRATSSSRMHALFGSTGKPSKAKKTLKQENISKKEELSSATNSVDEESKNEEEISSSLEKGKSSSMRLLLFGKRSKPKQEETKDLAIEKREDTMYEDIENSSADDKGSSIEISLASPEKPTERKLEEKAQDEQKMTENLQEETSKNSKPGQNIRENKKKRKNPATGTPGFFSLPDRRGKMRNEAKNEGVVKSEEQPQSALKENIQGGKKTTPSNSNTSRKKGFLSSLDRRKKHRQDARVSEDFLEKEENPDPIKLGNLESISNEGERPSQSSTETPMIVMVELPNERAVDVGEIQSDQLKFDSKEDLLMSSSYPRRKGKTRRELKKEDITLKNDMRQTTHVTWDPINKNFILHYTENEFLKQVLLEENLSKEAEPAPRQRRHSYSMAIEDYDAEMFEEIPRASVQSYSSVTTSSKTSRKGRRRKPRPRSEIVRANQPSTEL